MPNDLTGKVDPTQDSDLEMEAIRNDLESEDVFSMAFRGKEETARSKEDIWLKSSSSSDEAGPDLEATGMQDLRQAHTEL